MKAAKLLILTCCCCYFLTSLAAASSQATSAAEDETREQIGRKCRRQCRCRLEKYEDAAADDALKHENSNSEIIDFSSGLFQAEYSLAVDCRPKEPFQPLATELQPPIPVRDIRKLELDGELLEPMATLCDRLPNLSALTVKNVNFSPGRERFAEHAECVQALRLQSVEIRGLQWLDTTALMRLAELWLGGNPLQEGILRGFVFSSLHGLRELRLNESGIFKLDDDAFFNLNNLQRLDLSDNFISAVPRRALGPLSQLRELDLSGNWVIRLAPFDLNELLSLRRFQLERQNNQLMIVDREAFAVLPLLEEALLGGNNNLVYVSGGTFLFCPRLRVVDVSGSRVMTLDEGFVRGDAGGGEGVLEELNMNGCESMRCDCQVAWMGNATAVGEW